MKVYLSILRECEGRYKRAARVAIVAASTTPPSEYADVSVNMSARGLEAGVDIERGCSIRSGVTGPQLLQRPQSPGRAELQFLCSNFAAGFHSFPGGRFLMTFWRENTHPTRWKKAKAPRETRH